MIYKRGEVYWYEFRIAKIRHRGSTGLKNKRAAQEFHDDLKARKKREANGLETTITNGKTIYEALHDKDGYFAYCKVQFKESTNDTKKYAWNIIKKAIKDAPLHSINTKHVDAIQNYGVKNDVKNSTTNYRVDQFKAFVKWAKQKKHIQFNPLTDIERLSQPEPEDKLISDDDFNKLLEVCPSHLQEMIWVDWQTGMRLSNVVKLRYDQLDLEVGGINIAPVEMKKGKSVFIDLDSNLVEWFKRRRAAHPHDEYVWPNTNGQARNPKSLSTTFTRKARDLGLDCTFHSIRHTFATRWAKSGISILMISKLLSHRSLQSTQRYVHIEDLESQKEAKKRVVRTEAPQLPRLKVVG
jgi:integrase